MTLQRVPLPLVITTKQMSTKVKVYVTEHQVDKGTLDAPVISFGTVVKDDLSNVIYSTFSPSNS